MPYKVLSEHNPFLRLINSGVPSSGKTTNLYTFIYGPYDIFSDDKEEVKLALKYAEESQRDMAIISCPGEKGTLSLTTTDHVKPHIYETEDEANTTDAKWSKEAVDACVNTTEVLRKSGVDVLAIDGLHSLYEQKMNQITGGAYLNGGEFDTKLYGLAHGFIGDYISKVHHSRVPVIVVTTWEEWEKQPDNPAVQINKYTPQHLWPSLPGKMAKRIVGHFDGRLSCQIKTQCLHGKTGCDEYGKEHYVWQFLPKGDVIGVGVKGLRRITKQMKETPYIHQSYESLKQLMEQCR